MITKRQFIELVQDRLAGGDATMDVQGKFNYNVIEAVTSNALSDLAVNDRNSIVQIALPYTVTVTNNQATLPVKPLLGMKGIVWISKDGVFIPFATGIEESNLMSIIMPSLEVMAKRVNGYTLYLQGLTNAQYTETSIEVSIIPDFKELDEDADFIVEGQLTQLFSLVLQLMQPLRQEEVYDNSVPDDAKPTNPAK